MPTAQTEREDPERPSAPRAGPLGESWRAWLGLAVGVCAVSAHSALAYGMSPLMKPITDELGWTRTDYAGAINFRILLLTLLAPVAGHLVDRFGARAVLVFGCVAMGTGAIAMSFMQSLTGFYGSSVLTGPAQACVGSVAGSALVLRLFRRRHGLAIGILNGGDNLITSGVHVGSAHLLLDVGWRGALVVLGSGYLVLGLLILLVLHAKEGRSESDDARTGNALSDLPWRDSRLWLILLGYIPIYAFITSIGLHFPAFQRDLGRTPDVASWIYGLSTVTGAFGSILCGWLSERITARRTLLLVVVGLLLSSLVLWFPVRTEAWMAWAVGYGVVNAGAVALLALVLAESFGSARIGRLMGVAISVCMLATIAGNSFSAMIFDEAGTYAPVWRTYTVLLVVALVPISLLARHAALHRLGRNGS